MYPLEDWCEYFRFHAVLIGMSGTAVIPTMLRLTQACDEVGLPTATVDEISASFLGYTPEQVAASLDALADSDLRFTLLADCYQIAREAKVEAPEHEPALVRLAEHLAIPAEGRRAIAWFTWVCDPEVSQPHRDVLVEISASLARLRDLGIPPDAVTQAPGVTVPGVSSFAGLVRLCHEAL